MHAPCKGTRRPQAPWAQHIVKHNAIARTHAGHGCSLLLRDKIIYLSPSGASCTLFNYLSAIAGYSLAAHTLCKSFPQYKGVVQGSAQGRSRSCQHSHYCDAARESVHLLTFVTLISEITTVTFVPANRAAPHPGIPRGHYHSRLLTITTTYLY